MYDSNSEKKIQINYLLLGFVVMQVVFIVMGAVVIVSQLNKNNKIDENNISEQPHITINDFSQEITNFPVEKKEYLQSSLLEIALANKNNVNFGEVQAEIREGSVHEHYFALPNVSYASAIMDIPDLRQSYQVFLQSSEDIYNRYLSADDTIVFLCIVDSADIIYDDFECKDIYNQLTRNSLVKQFLRYFEFDGFRAGVEDKEYSSVFIKPDNFDEVNEERFIGETKDAIRSLGVSPDLFSYRVMKVEEYNFRIDR